MFTRTMFTLSTPRPVIRELDHRCNSGIDVRLLWNSRTNRVFVAVEDHQGGKSFEVTVPGAGPTRSTIRTPTASATSSPPSAQAAV